MSLAAQIIAGLQILCKERQAVTGAMHLTDSEYASIDQALRELGYKDEGFSHAGAEEWSESLRRCLFGP